MAGAVLGDLDTILFQSCMVAMILLMDTVAQVRWLSPGHIVTLSDCTVQIRPSFLIASLWSFDLLSDDARFGVPQPPITMKLSGKGLMVTDGLEASPRRAGVTMVLA